MDAPVLAPAPVTREDLLEWEDGDAYELVDGAPVRLNVSWETSWLAGRILRRLGAIEDAGLGFVSGSDNALVLWGRRDHFRRADVSFTRADRVPGGRPGDGDQYVPPDLVVEVVPSDQDAYSLEAGLRDFALAGVALTWIIYPNTRSARVHRLDGTESYIPPEGALSGETIIPGFTLPLSELLAGLPQETPGA